MGSQTVELAPVKNPTDLAALISPADDYFDPFVDLPEQPIDFEINPFLNDTAKMFQCFNSTLSFLNCSVANNTKLPSSAPFERLFTAGSLVLTARRNRLNDLLFLT